MTAVSLLNVQARWGYSEIGEGSNFSHCYNGSDIPALREKRNAEVSFEDLTADERYSLAFQCAGVRQCFTPFFVGIRFFDEVELTRSELANLLVPPIVWHESGGTLIVPFKHYIGTKTDAPTDPRNVVPNPAGYIPPADPLIVGRAYAGVFLLDGYHRAAHFWKQGSGDATIAAYKPHDIEAAL